MKRAWIVLVACSSASHEPVAVTTPTPPPEIPADAKLADAAPPPDASVDRCESWDEKNPACRTSYKACEHGADCKCVVPDVDNPACLATMPCPNPPDRRVRACIGKFPKTCDDNCPVDPVVGRIIRVDEQPSATIIVIAAGQDQGISKSWKGELLRGDSDEPLPNSAVEILRVRKRDCVGRIHVDAATLQANPHVKLTLTR